MAFLFKKSEEPDLSIIEVSNKNLALRVVLFIIALLASIFFISRGMYGLTNKAEGLYVIKAEPDDEAPGYANNYEFSYYLQGKSNDIKEETKKITSLYSIALKRAYKLTDPEKEYMGYNNLATINHKLSEAVNADGIKARAEVEISDELKAILNDAYAKTLEDKGYSVFAGAFYSHYYAITFSEDPLLYDPILNLDEFEIIRAIKDETRNTEGFKFDISDRLLSISESKDYIELSEEYELGEEVLDLNILRDAYVLKLVATEMEKAGYTKGYLTSKSGLVVTLSEYEGGEYAVYELKDKVALSETIKATPGTSFINVRAFPMMEGERGYYEISSNTGSDVLGFLSSFKTVYRMPYPTLSKDLYFTNESYYVIDTDPVNTVYKAYCEKGN